MTRRQFTYQASAWIVTLLLVAEGFYFFWLSSRIAASVRGLPGWRPDAPVPLAVLAGGIFGFALVGAAAIYLFNLWKIRGWFHALSPLFLIYGLGNLAFAGIISNAIYGELKDAPVAISMLSGFASMLIGVFAVIARLFLPRQESEGALPPNAPADRPEP